MLWLLFGYCLVIVWFRFGYALVSVWFFLSVNKCYITGNEDDEKMGIMGVMGTMGMME